MIKKYYCNRPDISPDSFTVMMREDIPFRNKAKIELSSYDPFCLWFVKHRLIHSKFREFETFYGEVVDLRGFEAIDQIKYSVKHPRPHPHTISFMFDQALNLPDPYRIIEKAFADYCNTQLYARIRLEEILKEIENLEGDYSFDHLISDGTVRLSCKIKTDNSFLVKSFVVELEGANFEDYITDVENALLGSLLRDSKEILSTAELTDNCEMQLDASVAIAQISVALQKTAKLKEQINFIVKGGTQ